MEAAEVWIREAMRDPVSDPVQKAAPEEAGGGGAGVSLSIDYTGVDDTADYVAPGLLASVNNAHCGVTSGVFQTVTDNAESSFYTDVGVMTLNGQKVVTVETPGTTLAIGSGKLVLFVADADEPGVVTIISKAATFSGYTFSMGSDGNVIVDRYLAGSLDASLGTFPFTSYSGTKVRLKATINADNVTWQAFKDDVEVGTALVDSSANRITNFKTAGKGMRKAFGQGCSVTGFNVTGAAA